MTVGQELQRLSGFKLFPNHVPIAAVAPYFSYGSTEGRALVQKLRVAFFDAFAKDTAGGYIFTFVWAFGEPGEREFMDDTVRQFEGHQIYWVELEADFAERQKRNRTENRLEHKPTKRDLEWSDGHIVEVEQKYRFNSVHGEIPGGQYLRINNTNLEPLEVAKMICAHFALPHGAHA